jgi:hypothetical protein
MHTTKNEITAKLRGIASESFRKIIQNMKRKRMKKERTELQAALMLGGIRRVK